MVYLGCHLSAASGFLGMGKTALSIGADTFQFFTRNPRGGNAKALDLQDAAALCAFMREQHFGPIVAHAPYTLNLCSDKPDIRDFARRTLADDLSRLAHIPGALYNFHPGSHVGQGTETGIAEIAEILNEVLTEGQHTEVLLETMAGKGSEIGGHFEELREIIDRVALKDRIGVCMDTCHIYDGGYDIVNNLDGVLTEFDRVIGLGRLKAMHLNDSKNPFCSHKDRHEKIGLGSIGTEAMLRIVRHPALQGLPMELETPNELPGYAAEIRLLREANA